MIIRITLLYFPFSSKIVTQVFRHPAVHLLSTQWKEMKEFETLYLFVSVSFIDAILFSLMKDIRLSASTHRDYSQLT